MDEEIDKLFKAVVILNVIILTTIIAMYIYKIKQNPIIIPIQPVMSSEASEALEASEPVMLDDATIDNPFVIDIKTSLSGGITLYAIITFRQIQIGPDFISKRDSERFKDYLSGLHKIPQHILDGLYLDKEKQWYEDWKNNSS